VKLGPLSADRGQRVSGLVQLEIAGRELQLPAILIKGTGDGPRLTVTAGIHGGEYPCVEAAVRLGAEIDPAHLNGELLLIPSANPLAFAARSIYTTPVDGKNLNRAFPGRPTGTFTEAWADWLFRNVISGSDAYIDLHGGDMIEALVPFVAFDVSGDDAVDSVAREMAEAFGIRYALARKTAGGPTGTTISAAASSSVPALLAEAGGQGVWDEQNVQILRSGVIRVMHQLGMLDLSDVDLSVPAQPEPTYWLKGWSWLRAGCSGLFYPAVEVGESVEEGQPLGRIASFFGEVGQELTSPAAGVVLFLVTSLAINEDDPLLAVAY